MHTFVCELACIDYYSINMAKRNKKSNQKNKLTDYYLENNNSVSSSVSQPTDYSKFGDFYQACLFDEIAANNTIESSSVEIQDSSNVTNGTGNETINKNDTINAADNAWNNKGKTKEYESSKKDNETIVDNSIASNDYIKATNNINPREEKCLSLVCLEEVCYQFQTFGSFVMKLQPCLHFQFLAV